LLFFPFDETTAELLLRHHLQKWRLSDEHQNYQDRNFTAVELGDFFLNPLSVSLMPVWLTADYTLPLPVYFFDSFVFY
jgi:hypothetical protein